MPAHCIKCQLIRVSKCPRNCVMRKFVCDMQNENVPAWRRVHDAARWRDQVQDGHHDEGLSFRRQSQNSARIRFWFGSNCFDCHCFTNLLCDIFFCWCKLCSNIHCHRFQSIRILCFNYENCAPEGTCFLRPFRISELWMFVL